MARSIVQGRHACLSVLALACALGAAEALAQSSDQEPRKHKTHLLADDGGSDTGTPGEAKKKKKHKDKDKNHDSADDAKATVSDSAANRKGKHVAVAGEMGLVDVVHFGYGANVGYFLAPNAVLEADYIQSSFELLGFDSKINLATVRFKYFLSNSFYLQAGAGFRQMESVDNSTVITTLTGSAPYSSTFDSTYAVGEIGLGNRWQFSNFTIGCDWVGYIAPLTKISSSESTSGAIPEAQLESDRSSFDASSKNGNLLLLRFHLGVAF